MASIRPRTRLYRRAGVRIGVVVLIVAAVASCAKAPPSPHNELHWRAGVGQGVVSNPAPLSAAREERAAELVAGAQVQPLESGSLPTEDFMKRHWRKPGAPEGERPDRASESGAFHVNQDIPLALEVDLVGTNWLRVDHEQGVAVATICAWVRSSIPKRRWDATLLLLDAQGQELVRATTWFENSTLYYGYPVWGHNEIRFDLEADWDRVRAAEKFVLTIARAGETRPGKMLKEQTLPDNALETGAFRVNEQIPLLLAVDLFRPQWMKVEKVNDTAVATVRGMLTSWPKRKWLIAVRLLNAEGRQVVEGIATFENSGVVAGLPGVGKRDVSITLAGDWEAIRKTEKYILTVARVDGEVTVSGTAEKTELDASEASKKPFVVTGVVTDEAGQPLPGVEITASCGWFTLIPTGRAVSGEDGGYTLRFGPGFISKDGVRLQAATIRPSLEGHYEKDLHRQGNLGMSGEPPSPDNERARQFRGIVLPGEPYRLNFVMAPGVKITGRFVDAAGRPVTGQMVSLDSEKLWPSASVLTNFHPDEEGRFSVTGMPCQPIWFVLTGNMKVGDVRSAPINFNMPGTYEVELVWNKAAQGEGALECKIFSAPGGWTGEKAAEE